MTGHYKNCSGTGECWCEIKRLSMVLGVTVVILLFEIIGGWLSGSLALMADAGHVFSDSAAIVVTLMAATLIKIRARTEWARDIAFKINIGLLLLVSSWIGFEAIERFQNPGEILSPILVSFALLSGVGNYLQHRLHKGAAKEHKDHAHRALSVHIISDLMQSGAVVLGGIAIWISGLAVIDPLLSLGIAVWIIYRAFELVLDPSDNNTD